MSNISYSDSVTSQAQQYMNALNAVMVGVTFSSPRM